MKKCLLALKPAHRHLAPADLDHANELAMRMTRLRSPNEHFECNRHFWDVVFGKAQRPVLREVLRTGGACCSAADFVLGIHHH